MLQKLKGSKSNTKEAIIVAVFSMYLFIYMTFETLCTKGSVGVISASEQLTMYYADQVFLVAGFILFAVIWSKISSDDN